MVEVTEGGGGQLEGAEADVVQRLIVKDHALVGVLHQLVHRQGGIVGLHHGVRHLQGAGGQAGTGLCERQPQACWLAGEVGRHMRLPCLFIPPCNPFRAASYFRLRPILAGVRVVRCEKRREGGPLEVG